ncbi:unnamed protein product [Polarella glacialis]|uniref:Uncharacterized protein n=1 Tax=Polarella glacialis TaxID=89957 RepID=A0A813HNM9_POLGL|nr:unnamed protein product [Polarella glacialis]
MGLMLNRPTPKVAKLGNVELNVWYGGPCHGLDLPTSQQWSYCLHTRPDLAESDFVEPMIRGVFLAPILRVFDYVAQGRAKPEEFMLVVGHCGWEAGQLQRELDDGGTWTMAAADVESLIRQMPPRQAALSRSRRFRGRAALGCGLPMWRQLQQRVSNATGGGMLDRHGDAALRDWVQSSFGPTGSAMRIPDPAQEPGVEELVQKVLSLMTADSGSAFTQEQGCEALRNLVVDDATRSLVAEKGGIQAVMRAIRAHRSEPGVQGHCFGTLTHLAASVANRKVISSFGGLSEVLSAMDFHRSSALVQYKACAVLANFAASASEQLEVASLGGVEAALRAMQQHPTEKEVQDYCCGTLYNLAAISQNRLKIMSLGGIQAVERAMLEHPGADSVQRVGVGLLSVLRKEST